MGESEPVHWEDGPFCPCSLHHTTWWVLPYDHGTLHARPGGFCFPKPLPKLGISNGSHTVTCLLSLFYLPLADLEKMMFQSFPMNQLNVRHLTKRAPWRSHWQSPFKVLQFPFKGYHKHMHLVLGQVAHDQGAWRLGWERNELACLYMCMVGRVLRMWSHCMELAQCHQRGPTPSPKDEVYGFVKKRGKTCFQDCRLCKWDKSSSDPCSCHFMAPLGRSKVCNVWGYLSLRFYNMSFKILTKCKSSLKHQRIECVLETHGAAAVQCLVIWVWQQWQWLWQRFVIWRCCGATCQKGEAIGGFNLQFILESAAVFGAGYFKCLVIPRFVFYLSCWIKFIGARISQEFRFNPWKHHRLREMPGIMVSFISC